MASLKRHLVATENHAGLPFHRDCPVCVAERLAGPLPDARLVALRARAGLATAAVVVSGLGSAPMALATDGEDESAQVTPQREPVPPAGAELDSTTEAAGEGTAASAGSGSAEITRDESSSYPRPPAGAPADQSPATSTPSAPSEPAASTPRGQSDEVAVPKPPAGAGTPVDRETTEPRPPAEAPRPEVRPDETDASPAGPEAMPEPRPPANLPDSVAAPEVVPEPRPPAGASGPDETSTREQAGDPDPRSAESEPAAAPRDDLRPPAAAASPAPRTTARTADESPRTDREGAVRAPVEPRPPAGAAEEPSRRTTEGAESQSTRPTDDDRGRPAEEVEAMSSTSNGSSKPAVHVVDQGDSLWAVAREALRPDASTGEIARYVSRIWAENADTIGTGNPDLIIPGQQLRMPT